MFVCREERGYIIYVWESMRAIEAQSLSMAVSTLAA